MGYYKPRQKLTGELLNKRKDNTLFRETVSFSTLKNSDGCITNFVVIFDDITEKKEKINELIAAKNKAEEMNLLKKNFCSNMSYELRTPMTGIMGYAEIPGEELAGDETLHSIIRIIEQGGEKLINSLNKILIISRLES